MIEHKPWVGTQYPAGIGGQRVAIMGHSHHGLPDSENFTLCTMRRVIAGKLSTPFFNNIPGYFDYEDKAAFWNSILFFNYLPDSVGLDEQRYKYGTPEQLRRAKGRFLRILRARRPDKLFVFTKAMWKELPASREYEPPFSIPSGERNGNGFVWCTYDVGGHIVMAFGLSHAERAPKQTTHSAVQRILAMPPPT